MPGGALAVQQTENIPEYRGKIDLAEAFKLKFKHNYTFQQLANRYGVVPSAVHGALKNFLNLMHSPEQSRIYEEKRAEILNSVEFRIVTQMVNKKKLKAASLNNLAYAASQINNMLRLEKGQPTAITEHLDSDLGSMIDQLCGLKSTGSGSTIDVTPRADTPAAPINLLESLEAPNQFIQSIEPVADRAVTGSIEGSKSASSCKPRTIKPSKSIVKCRKQASSNITTVLNSKVDETKEGTSAALATGTQSSQQKEWYE